MISLETDKVCKHLGVENKMFVCEIERQKDRGRINTARCMMDPRAAAFLDQRYCPDYKNKGGETNGNINKK